MLHQHGRGSPLLLRPAVRVGSTSGGGSPASARSPQHSRARLRIAGQRSASMLGGQRRLASTEHAEASREYARIRSDYAASSGRIRSNTERIRPQSQPASEHSQRITSGDPGSIEHEKRIRSDYGRLRAAGWPGAHPSESRCSQSRTDAAHKRTVVTWRMGYRIGQTTANTIAARPAERVAGGRRGCQRLRIRCEHVATTQRRQENT